MRRSALFLLVIATVLAALALPVALAPASAEAAINSVVWLDTAYKGSDPLLGSYVQAYEAGSTATLLVSIQNTTGDTITLKGAKVKFDWTGGEYVANAGDYPATLANNQSGTATISFTVPDTSVASNQVRHSYTVSVDYEGEGGYSAGTRVSREDPWGGGAVRHTHHSPVDPSTLQVYVNGVLSTGYTLDCYDGDITFSVAPSGSVNVDYQYVEDVGQGDGTETVFYLDHSPVVSASQAIYVNCTLSTSYTLDYETGRIKFTTAPESGHHIIANYQYSARWSESGGDFAIYSTDQRGAMEVKQKLNAIMGTITSSYPGVVTANSRELLTKAAVEGQLGDQQYAAGNVDEAKANYDQGLIYAEDALKKDKDPNAFKLLAPTGTLMLGIGMVLLALGVIGFVVFRRPKGPPST